MSQQRGGTKPRRRAWRSSLSHPVPIVFISSHCFPTLLHPEAEGLRGCYGGEPGGLPAAAASSWCCATQCSRARAGRGRQGAGCGRCGHIQVSRPEGTQAAQSELKAKATWQRSAYAVNWSWSAYPPGPPNAAAAAAVGWLLPTSLPLSRLPRSRREEEDLKSGAVLKGIVEPGQGDERPSEGDLVSPNQSVPAMMRQQPAPPPTHAPQHVHYAAHSTRT